ncbi:MAG: HAD family hydrolase [Pseudomonadota bacterium]
MTTPAAVPPIQAVLFDKDGTLFDFAATWRHPVERMLIALAPDPADRAEMAARGGYDQATGRFTGGSALVEGDVAAIVEAWAPLRPDLGADGLRRRLTEIWSSPDSQPDALVPASRDLQHLLTGLLGDGLTLGVATNDFEAAADEHLRAAGVREVFSFIAGYDSVPAPKPAPDMVLAFAAATGIAPAEIAMIGDSTHDMACARAAGCGLRVGVLTGPASHADLAPHADHVIDSIDALPALLAGL